MSTYGDLRKYTVLYEGTPPMDTVQCPNCYIRAVPRAASSGGYHLIYSDQEAIVGMSMGVMI